uniref:nucleotidyltransferase domain-containing protein n=1 Tax=Paractinoplanes polyasparticus TaxID=2856853 RepID=UPI001C841408|nr:nucleotidyltransferase domain-containing protein [Actinoplanes polyasparticus]
MLVQQRLLERVARLCRDDPRLVAALTYGSFVSGEADAHSDVEFWLFFGPAATPDARAWLAEVGELRHVVVNEFGAAAWGVGRDAWQQLAARHGFALPEALFQELDQRLSGPASQS